MHSYFRSCEESDPAGDTPETVAGETIASFKVANESVLRSIPEEYINLARTTLHIAYQHTSHGTHVSFGMFGLPGYKSGDELLFAITTMILHIRET